MASWKKVVIESSSDTIAQDTSGNAGTATTLETARNIGGVSFNGSANIDLPGVNTAGDQDTSGTSATATALENARTIGGVSFDGTANINLPGVNTSGTQDTSGNAATATALAAGRTIAISGDISASGVSFDGTSNIIISGTSLATDSVGNAELDLVTNNSAADGNILSYSADDGGDFKWIANTAAANDSTVTLTAGAGLSGGGSFTTNQGSTSTVTFALATNPDIAGTLDVTGVATFDNNVTIAGNLTVTGSTTTVESTNLLVDDTFISLNDNAAANADTGIVFGGADNKVFGWDNGQENGRFGVDYTGGNAATSGGGFSPDGWVSVTHSNSAAPTDVSNGDTDSLRQIGNIYVNSANEDIYIYS